MLRFFLAILALTTIVVAENHKVFRIIPESEDQLDILRKFKNEPRGFRYWKDPSFVSNEVDLMVAPQYISQFTKVMQLNNIQFQILIDDVEALLKNENITPNYARSNNVFGWTSYHNLEEIYSWLDTLAQRYPKNVEIIIGGETYEGRQIKGVKLSFGSNKPGVFIEGGIHAREWISHATVTYLINQFLISEDPSIRQLAESHDWYMFPVFNPDGYAYTHINPTNIEYRLWRKTRSPHRSFFYTCYGTDMNRNFDFEWMSIGANRYACAEDYAGSKPFSEIETRTLAKYISSISDKLFAYISFHSYSQLLMFPYGHTKKHLDNYDEQYAIGKKTIEALSKRYGTIYRTGSVSETLTYAGGLSLDWIKANLKLPLVYVYELRDKGNRGFILPAEQIIPTGEEVLDSLVALFTEAKKYGVSYYFSSIPNRWLTVLPPTILNCFCS